MIGVLNRADDVGAVVTLKPVKVKRRFKVSYGSHKPKCPSCGFRIRGNNHEDGVHHKTGRNGHTN